MLASVSNHWLELFLAKLAQAGFKSKAAVLQLATAHEEALVSAFALPTESALAQKLKRNNEELCASKDMEYAHMFMRICACHHDSMRMHVPAYRRKASKIVRE